jgi:hypothetical protein
MYQSPSIHFELGRQRQADFLREAKADQLAALVEAKPRTQPVREGLGVLGARLGRYLHRRPVRQAGLRPAS